MAGCQKKEFAHQSWPFIAEHKNTKIQMCMQMCKNVQKK